MRGCTLLVLSLLAAPSLAQAASFPCAKASTPTEKAICADPGLSKLDEQLSAAYRAALNQLSGSSPEEGQAQTVLKADQRAWLGERNACGGDQACLKTAQERRLAVLSFHPAPGAPSPVDAFAGVFEYKGVMTLAILPLRNGQAAVSISGAEPTSGRWVCDFSGVGQVKGDGRLTVGTPDADGNGVVIETRGTSGLEIPDNDANQAVSTNWCGAGGSFVLPYRRKG
ncbi:lysozyme inhibitor LprI family protein [Azospirillum canadense]|uniref:lysozyme inhibitor LprI family protein n=1 Tax=Azospirillum canadense TaxID=403962 RepID=UPI002227BB6C|nr:lysozyme inhibitor LprI family protein [Azospirillum canadense]MCW2238951.1 uncharacterized protein [Azospirillum canadense]